MVQWLRRKMTASRCWRLAPLVALLAATSTFAQEGHAPPRGDRTLELPVAHAAGIAGDGTRLWVLDGEAGEILELAPDSGEVLGRFSLGLEGVRGLVFDGTLLWVAEPAVRRLHAFRPSDGAPSGTVPVEVPPEKGYSSVTALAWDGQDLWTAIAAGFSSSFNQVDRETGQIRRSLFADCDPRGLAIAGDRLWSLCESGGRQPPVVDVRRLSDDETAFQRSRQLLRRAEGRTPSGLFFDGTLLWFLDADSHRAVAFAPKATDHRGAPR